MIKKKIKKQRINLIVPESIYLSLISMSIESGTSMNGIINIILAQNVQAFRETEYYKVMSNEIHWQDEKQMIGKTNE